MKLKSSSIILFILSLIVMGLLVAKDESKAPNDRKFSEVTKSIHKQRAKPSDFLHASENLQKTQKTQPPIKEPTLQELAGEVENPYGIRRDILKYIQEAVPGDNDKAMKAAIVFAQVMQQIYYHSTKSEALNLDKLENLAIHCLGNAMPNVEGYEVIRRINKIMRNTTARDKHMWDIDERYFGWAVLGMGINFNDADRVCAEGKY